MCQYKDIIALANEMDQELDQLKESIKKTLANRGDAPFEPRKKAKSPAARNISIKMIRIARTIRKEKANLEKAGSKHTITQ